jgi:hypothetical protein
MKLTTIILVTALAASSTYALAAGGTYSGSVTGSPATGSSTAFPRSTTSPGTRTGMGTGHGIGASDSRLDQNNSGNFNRCRGIMVSPNPTGVDQPRTAPPC